MSKYQPSGPPPPGFMPPPPYSHTESTPNVIIIQNPVFGPDTQSMTCPHCHTNISTRVTQSPSAKTHLFALLFCVIGFWPCAPCPYCIDSCLIKKHYCPACNQYLGEYEG